MQRASQFRVWLFELNELIVNYCDVGIKKWLSMKSCKIFQFSFTFLSWFSFNENSYKSVKIDDYCVSDTICVPFSICSA